ncbi:hypothetical protein THII_0277 [Thioploca ingrica]|uniref:Peptidase metallopeptidase domain-containing protein n=1 Tax=Thioploca ingrica TaxID=40754 RepID=A0A090ACT1_9GAMM|nr:hypothetical protein THII_0277 [Thioploca ingrica]
MLKFSRLLATLGLLISLGLIPLKTLAAELPELGTQGIDIEGRPVKTTATFSGGFSIKEELFRGDGNINVANPVKIRGEIKVDPNHLGKMADFVVYVHYSTLDAPNNIISLMLAEDGRILPWNSEVTSLVPFVKLIPLQANHSLEIYNGLLPESQVQVYFGYLLEDGTLITNQLPIDIVAEIIPEAVNTKAVEQAKQPVRIDVTPLLTEESDGRLVGQYALRWPNGQNLKVGFDFDGANFDNPPAVCPVGMERSACENAVADVVIETASAWSQYGNIYFRKTSWDEADIRVRFRERGSYSVVGTDAQERARNEETMNLAFSFLTSPENFRGTILHEFGHAIGLQHEHNSPNVAYHWNEAQIIAELAKWGWDEQKVRSNVIDSLLKGNSKSAFFVTEFDPNSIMIYYLPKTWVSAEDLADPQKCPDATTEYYCVAPKTDLSAKDKAGIAGFYPQGSLGNGCSYTYNPNDYRPGAALWDGHSGSIAFNNPTVSTVTVKLYHPDIPQWTWGTWIIPARTESWLYDNNQKLILSMDWGIQVNDSPICILKVVSNWDSDGNYFQASTTQLPGM